MHKLLLSEKGQLSTKMLYDSQDHQSRRYSIDIDGDYRMKDVEALDSQKTFQSQWVSQTSLTRITKARRTSPLTSLSI
jgi:hypothetical protein